MKISEKHYASVKYFLYLAAFLAIFSYFHFLTKAMLTSKFPDFANYYAHTKLLFSGHNIWEQTPSLTEKINLVLAQCNIETMCTGVAMHSIGFFLMVYPFSLIPFKLASILWVIMCQIALASSFILIYKMKGENNKLLISSGLFLVFFFWPLREDLFLGQPNCLILFFLTLALFYLKKDRLLLSGLFWGIAIQIKEIFLPFLLFLLIKKYHKALFAAIGVILLPKLIYAFFFGIENEINYFRMIINSFGSMNLDAGQANLSVLSILKRTTGAYANSGLVQLTVICIEIFLLFFTWRALRCRINKEENIELEFAYFTVFCLLFSPWLHESHFVVLSLVTILCWLYLADNPKETNFLYFLIGYFLLGSKYSLESFSAFDTGWLSFLTTGKTIGLILFYCLLYRLISRRFLKNLD